MASTPQYSSDSFLSLDSRKKKFEKSLASDLNYSTENECFNGPLAKEVPTHFPWKKRSAYSPGVIGLHEEINDFYEVMCPTEEETDIRLHVVEHITKVIHSLWSQAKVEVFGSFRTGLYLPSSDIDMVVIGEWKSLPLSTLSKALESSGIRNSDIDVIANATVPIIRILHSPSKVRVDISFNMDNGIKSAKLIKKLIKEFPALPKLVLVLKQFLLQRGLNEVYNGGMSSYTLTLLIVSFLQGYHKPKTEPSLNLGTLLIEFFELYGINFNYEKVSIHFQKGGCYQPRFREPGPFLSVEDPLVAGHDVAKGTFLMHQLKLAFQNAFHILHLAITRSTSMKKGYPSFLQLIVNVDDDTLITRQWMQQNYPSILQSLSSFTDELHRNPVESYCKNTKKKKMR